MEKEQIIQLLPYQNPFLFVDVIDTISDDGVTGHYRFKEDEAFYKGHFKNNPVTPGVILTETMAQIGVVSFGIYLLSKSGNPLNNIKIALTSSEVDFFKPIFPSEKVIVKSKKEYFRFNKLKWKVEMYNEEGMFVCRGKISGMMQY